MIDLVQTVEEQMAEMTDNIGSLQAQIARLEEQLTAEKAELLALADAAGAKEVKGQSFTAKVIDRVQKRVSWKSVAERLNPSYQLIARHTKTVESHFLTVGGRK